MSRINELIKKTCPNGVETIQLRYLIVFTNGKGHEKVVEENGQYILITSKAISTNMEQVRRTNAILTPLFKNDITMVMSDLPNGRALAKCFIVDEDNKYTLNQRVCGLKVRDEKQIIPQYLYYVLNRNTQLLRYDNGVDQTNLRKDDILNIDIPVPPLEVQEEIVRILDNFTESLVEFLAELSAELKSRQEQYKYYRNYVLNNINADEKTLGEVCTFLRGPFGGSLKKECFKDNGYAVYEQQHAIYKKLDFRYYIDEIKYNELKRFTVNPGDIIVSCSGTIGKVYIIPENAPKGIINQALLKLTPNSNIKAEYIKYFFENTLTKQLNGSARGGAIKNVPSVEELKKTKILIPAIEEQEKIIKMLDKFEKLYNDISESLLTEIEARQKQYEYYRDKLLTFKE